MPLEIAAQSLTSARRAQSAGADRLELATALGVGGLTPPPGLIRTVLQAVDLPVYALIRPRPGDFTYSEDELQTMEASIAFCVSEGIQGIVSGALRPDRTVDRRATARLQAAAGGLPFTFHRAFDWTPDPRAALRTLLQLGIPTLLSSGQAPKAEQGLHLLQQLKDAAGEALTIMPGSGIQPGNVERFRAAGFSWLHASGTIPAEKGPAPPPFSLNTPAMLSEHISYESDTDRIREMVRRLHA